MNLESTADLLTRVRVGDREAFETLFAQLYDELRVVAHGKLRYDAVTLSTTALVNEAYLRFGRIERLDLKDRAHFKSIVARAMRQVLVDMARRKKSAKRGSDMPHVVFDEAVHQWDGGSSVEDVINLDLAVDRLSSVDERQARVFEYRFFGEMEYQEIASVLGVSEPTVRRDWQAARAVLTRWLSAA